MTLTEEAQPSPSEALADELQTELESSNDFHDLGQLVFKHQRTILAALRSAGRKDGERYRWLRKLLYMARGKINDREVYGLHVHFVGPFATGGDTVEECIDAAIAAEGET